MGKVIDISGKKFGKLFVLCNAIARSSASSYWLCVCECGNSRKVSSSKLRGGLTKTCGCGKREGNANRKHGHSPISGKSRTYHTWRMMRQRCRWDKSDNYKWYGGRGIYVCDSWDSFENFLNDMGERPPGKTLDRIDGDGPYMKENCQWASPKEQAANNRGCFKKSVTK